jgi:hypothetical protein
MAIKDWHKPLEVMEREAIATLAELTAADPDEPPTREMAARVVATAHQIPELVERGAFPPGELDDEAMRAMAVVVDIAAAWEDEAESLREFVASLDAEDLARLGAAAHLWARAVWEEMVPLGAAEKERVLAAYRRG